jgi:hypothetical protein
VAATLGWVADRRWWQQPRRGRPRKGWSDSPRGKPGGGGSSPGAAAKERGGATQGGQWPGGAVAPRVRVSGRKKN